MIKEISGSAPISDGGVGRSNPWPTRLRLIGSIFLWLLAAVGALALMLLVYFRTQLGY